jgi:predicted metal-dependent HD superfamily phosphohydrolase
MRVAQFLIEDALTTLHGRPRPELSQPLFEELVKQYGEEGRLYHNLDHAEEVAVHIAHLMRKTGWGEYPRHMMIMAGLWHDYVDPKSPTAEADSAECFAEMVYAFFPEDAGLWTADCVKAIGATAGHDFTEDRFSQIMSDADLQRFKVTDDRFARQIRMEYAEHPDEKFNQGRMNVLVTYLLREPFFYFEDDTPATDNIKRQLKETIRLIKTAGN